MEMWGKNSADRAGKFWKSFVERGYGADLKAGLFVLAAVGLWTVLYPDMVFNSDVCQVVQEDPTERQTDKTGEEEEKRQVTAKNPRENTKKTDGDRQGEVAPIWETDRSRIRLRSRLWDSLIGLYGRGEDR